MIGSVCTTCGGALSKGRCERAEEHGSRPWATVADLVRVGVAVPYPLDPQAVVDEAERLLRGPEPDLELTHAIAKIAVERILAARARA